MKMNHLTDAELQQYAAEPQSLDPAKTAHVLSCKHCSAKADNYQVLFQSLQNAQSPEFTFDLSGLVLEQLPDPKNAFPWLTAITGCASALVATFSMSYFWSVMITLAKGMSGMILPMAAVAGVSVLIFQSFEMFRSYQQRMRTLLSEKTLQL